MTLSLYSLLAIFWGGAGAIIGTAMLFLVLWQSSRRTENWLMAAYMGVVMLWGGAVFAQHVAAVVGGNSTFFLYVNTLAIGASGPVLFGLVTYYTHSWQKHRWVQYGVWSGIGLLVLITPPLFAGWLVTDLHISAAGETIYTILPLGYATFVAVYLFHIGTLVTLLRHRHAHTAFVIGGILVSLGTLSVAVSNTLANYPIAVSSATISAVLFAYTIIRHNVLSPLVQLNQDLESANAQLSILSQNAQKSEASLRALLENTTDLVWSVNANYQLVTINLTAVDFYELVYGQRLAVGNNILQGLPANEQEVWQSNYGRALQGERFSIENRYQLHDKLAPIFLEITFNPIYDDAHEVSGVALFARDITKRIETERQLRMQALTFEHLSESVIITNLEGRIVDCNAATEAIFGYSRTELLGELPEMWHDPDVEPMTEIILEGVRRHGRWVGDIRFVRKNGQRGICDALVLPIYDERGQRMAALGVSRDITERKQYEAELQEAKEAAESANRAKSAFLASMSHELRTPLNAIIGYSEMLWDISQDQGYGEFTADLDRITTSGRHLLSLINDILDLSKIEAGKVNLYLEHFSLATLLNEAVLSTAALVEQNGNTLELYIAPDVGLIYADAVKMRQILLNLISNAAKFTTNGSVNIRAERETADPTDLITIQVEDTGIGMTFEETRRIFQAFTQADDSTTRRYGGTGLGLTISHRFCQMMGGSISVDSQPGRGSVFTVHLPARVTSPTEQNLALNDRQESPNENTTIMRPAPTRGVLLVIDDDPDDRDRIVRWLHGEGYRVYAAATGERGVKLAIKLQPLAIIIDVHLALADGWETIAEIQHEPYLGAIPILIASVLDEPERRRVMGFMDYLPKPLERRALLDKVAHMVMPPTAVVPSNHHILLVEDNYPLRHLMRLSLEKHGWRVREAVDALMGLEILDDMEARPSLVVVDLMLPQMDGFELVDRIRKMPHTAHIPIIVVTAKQLSTEEHRQLDSLVAHILYKGFYTQTELLHRVNTLIGRELYLKQAPTEEHTP